MKLKKTFLILTQVMLMGSLTGIAHAEIDRQVWRSSDGEVVRNSWDNCVRSRWATNDDACAEYMAQPVVLHQPALTRTSILQEDRTVYFEFNKARLTAESKSKLDALADQLTSADDVEGAKVVGYADRIGTASYNEVLSKKRAAAVRNYLVGRGFVKPSETQVHWVGKSEPSVSCPRNLSHQQLIDCLQPDRKVSVELQYKQVSSNE